jgi:hypothetical protein
MYEDNDAEILKKVRTRKKKSFSAAINSKDLTEEEMDDLFLSS